MADFDVVIVGAGAGGGVAAHVLTERGYQVALLEKGRNATPRIGRDRLVGSLFGDDEIKHRRHFAWHDPFIEPRTFRAAADRPAAVARVQELGVGVGGGTNQYDGNSPRLQRADFRLRSTFGPIEGTAVVDWPIGYDDLAPYYELAEQLIGVQGQAGSDPFAETRGPYPMPPGFRSKVGELLSAGARALGYHPHPMPVAINSIPYGGRPACQNAGFCNIGCPTNAKGSTAVTAIHSALRTGRLTLLSECCVSALRTEPSGEQIGAVDYLDPTGAPATVRGRQVILALNAIETPRLLLSSSNAAHPDGIGNRSGLLGRNLMFHLVLTAAGIFDEEVRSYRSRVSTHGFSDFTVDDGSPDFVRGGYVELGGFIHPVEEGINYPLLLHRDLMLSGRYRRRIGTVTLIGEDVPVRDNRVDLDPSVRDVYGRAVARVTYARHAHDQAVADRYLPKLAEVARAAGAVEVLQIDEAQREGAPNTRHLLGTTRMGTDPETSVTDSFGRLHDVDNAWIADGGIWPTSSAFNPTLTQQALAWRTADRIAEVLG